MRSEPLSGAVAIDHLRALQGSAGQEKRLSQPFEIVGEGSPFAEQEAVFKSRARAGVALGHGNDELFHLRRSRLV